MSYVNELKEHLHAKMLRERQIFLSSFDFDKLRLACFFLFLFLSLFSLLASTLEGEETRDTKREWLYPA